MTAAKKTMDRTQAMQQWETGQSFIAPATFHAFKADEQRRKVPKAGKSATYIKAISTVMIGSRPVVVAQMMPDGTKLSEVLTPFKAGDKCFLVFTEMKRVGYTDCYEAFGLLYPVTQDTKKPA